MLYLHPIRTNVFDLEWFAWIYMWSEQMFLIYNDFLRFTTDPHGFHIFSYILFDFQLICIDLFLIFMVYFGSAKISVILFDFLWLTADPHWFLKFCYIFLDLLPIRGGRAELAQNTALLNAWREFRFGLRHPVITCL